MCNRLGFFGTIHNSIQMYVIVAGSDSTILSGSNVTEWSDRLGDTLESLFVPSSSRQSLAQKKSIEIEVNN